MSTPKERVEGFEPFEWQSGEEGGTPITAERLNAVEAMLADLAGFLGGTDAQLRGQLSGLQTQLNAAHDTANSASAAVDSLEGGKVFALEGITSGLQDQVDTINDRLDALEGEEEEAE